MIITIGTFIGTGFSGGDSPSWYVRPAGTTYGTGDGSSYDNAWSGAAGIQWNEITDGGKLYIAGTWVETLTVGKSNVTIESLIADPCTINGESLRTECLIIDGKQNVTIDGLTLINATVSCGDVRGVATGIVYVSVTASGSGNQAFQNQGSCSVTYNYCTGSTSVDDGLSLHDTAVVVANFCTFSGNSQGVNGINTTNFTANGCTFTSNTTSIQPDTSANFTINDSFIDTGFSANSSVSLKLNRCRLASVALTTGIVTSAGTLVMTDCRIDGGYRIEIRSAGNTVQRCYLTPTQSRPINTTNAGDVDVNYCVWKISTSGVFALRGNSTGTVRANNCSVVGTANVGNGFEALSATGVVAKNCIFYDLNNAYTTSGSGIIVADFCNRFDITTVVSGTGVTQTNTLTLDPQFVNIAGEDFTTGASMKNAGTSTGITTGIASASWGDSDTAPVVVTAEQSGTYDLGAYIAA